MSDSRICAVSDVGTINADILYSSSLTLVSLQHCEIHIREKQFTFLQTKSFLSCNIQNLDILGFWLHM